LSVTCITAFFADYLNLSNGYLDEALAVLI
jgi:hypothetical protein